jgi:ammonia channel protein AmtB
LSSGYRVFVVASEEMLVWLVRLGLGKFETGLCSGKVAVNTLGNAEVKYIGQFVQVSWPVGRFSGGKVSVGHAHPTLSESESELL